MMKESGDEQWSVGGYIYIWWQLENTCLVAIGASEAHKNEKKENTKMWVHRNITKK